MSWVWLIFKPQQQPSQRYCVCVSHPQTTTAAVSGISCVCVTYQETTAAAVSANSCVWRILKPQQQQSQRYCVCPFIKPQQHPSQRYRVCVCVLWSNDGLGRNRAEVVRKWCNGKEHKLQERIYVERKLNQSSGKEWKGTGTNGIVRREHANGAPCKTNTWKERVWNPIKRNERTEKKRNLMDTKEK